MTERRTVLVDIGNSAIKLAATPAMRSPRRIDPPAADPLRMLRFDLRHDGWVDRIAREVRASLADGTEDAPLRWLVASVNSPAAESLRQRLSALSPADQWTELTCSDIPMQCELRSPTAVGIDRLLGAMAACKRSGGADVVAIDAGSAITVDLVQQKIFKGGAILPGLRLQLASLARGTDRLPIVASDTREPLEVPGRDTTAAIRTGVLLGIAGGIDRLVERYSEQCEEHPEVFLTGGDAEILEPLLNQPLCRCDNLVLSAVADVAAALGYDG